LSCGMTDNALDIAIQAGEAKAAGGSFDAIVVGSGAAGGLAASLLCEAGLSVLVLDAGYKTPFWKRPLSKTTETAIKAIANPKLIKVIPYRVINFGRKFLRAIGRIRQPIQTECFSWEQGPGGFVDDRDHPYVTPQGRPFTWIRSHGLGGRMVLPGHGWQYYRLGEEDLSPADNQSPTWPVSYNELDKWYAFVETRLKLAGREDHVPSPPDGVISRELSFSAAENQLAGAISKRWSKSTPIMGRFAPPLQSLAQAADTGRLVCRVRALVQRLSIGNDGRIDGVEWRDQKTGHVETSSAPLVFLCASTLETTRILLMSKGANGKAPGAESDALGRNLMDHLMIRIEGIGPKLPTDSTPDENGRCVYLPRFDHSFHDDRTKRGFGVQIYPTPTGAQSWLTAVAFAEVTPRSSNRVTLDESRKDVWGNPALKIDFQYSSAELEVGRVMANALREIANVAKAKVRAFDGVPARPGTSIHECGTARMGSDRTNSVLDPNNECWDVPGLFVTDGASFPSQGAQNPTLTIMALTARACDYAVKRIKAPA